MAQEHRAPQVWREDMEVVPRNLREYHNFTVGDQARVIAGDVHFNSVNPRGTPRPPRLRTHARHVLTQDMQTSYWRVYIFLGWNAIISDLWRAILALSTGFLIRNLGSMSAILLVLVDPDDVIRSCSASRLRRIFASTPRDFRRGWRLRMTSSGSRVKQVLENRRS
jgi:hypothetical protein